MTLSCLMFSETFALAGKTNQQKPIKNPVAQVPGGKHIKVMVLQTTQFFSMLCIKWVHFIFPNFSRMNTVLEK